MPGWPLQVDQESSKSRFLCPVSYPGNQALTASYGELTDLVMSLQLFCGTTKDILTEAAVPNRVTENKRGEQAIPIASQAIPIASHGFALVEILVAMSIISIGLLGLAG